VIDERWMAAALAEALKSEEDVPIGALVVKDGVVIGAGHNQREKTKDPTGHAEIIAIRQAAQYLGDWRLNGTTIYTTLEPCPMCAEAILQARVERLVFGAYDYKSGACGSVFNLYVDGRIYPIPEVVGGIMEDPCQNVLVEFFRSKPTRVE
jgi:tRNA(adenine34) deaminase